MKKLILFLAFLGLPCAVFAAQDPVSEEKIAALVGITASSDSYASDSSIDSGSDSDFGPDGDLEIERNPAEPVRAHQQKGQTLFERTQKLIDDAAQWFEEGKFGVVAPEKKVAVDNRVKGRETYVSEFLWNEMVYCCASVDPLGCDSLVSEVCEITNKFRSKVPYLQRKAARAFERDGENIETWYFLRREKSRLLKFMGKVINACEEVVEKYRGLSDTLVELQEQQYVRLLFNINRLKKEKYEDVAGKIQAESEPYKECWDLVCRLASQNNAFKDSCGNYFAKRLFDDVHKDVICLAGLLSVSRGKIEAFNEAIKRRNLFLDDLDQSDHFDKDVSLWCRFKQGVDNVFREKSNTSFFAKKAELDKCKETILNGLRELRKNLDICKNEFKSRYHWPRRAPDFSFVRYFSSKKNSKQAKLFNLNMYKINRNMETIREFQALKEEDCPDLTRSGVAQLKKDADEFISSYEGLILRLNEDLARIKSAQEAEVTAKIGGRRGAPLSLEDYSSDSDSDGSTSTIWTDAYSTLPRDSGSGIEIAVEDSDFEYEESEESSLEDSGTSKSVLQASPSDTGLRDLTKVSLIVKSEADTDTDEQSIFLERISSGGFPTDMSSPAPEQKLDEIIDSDDRDMLPGEEIMPLDDTFDQTVKEKLTVVGSALLNGASSVVGGSGPIDIIKSKRDVQKGSRDFKKIRRERGSRVKGFFKGLFKGVVRGLRAAVNPSSILELPRPQRRR